MRYEKWIVKIILPKFLPTEKEWNQRRRKALDWYSQSSLYKENPNPEIVIHPLRNVVRFRNMRLRRTADGSLSEQLFVYFGDGWEESPCARLLHWICDFDIIKGFYMEAQPLTLAEFLEKRERML